MESGYGKNAADLNLRYPVRSCNDKEMSREATCSAGQNTHSLAAAVRPGTERNITEMVRQSSHTGYGRSSGMHTERPIRSGPWRCGDCGDYLLHEYLQPQRAACRRAAGKEGGRKRPVGQAAYQDLARARITRGDRIPPCHRPARLIWKNLAFTSRVMAAPLASAIRVRYPSRSRKR